MSEYKYPDFTAGPWKIGTYRTTVVSEVPIKGTTNLSGHADTKFYGGHLIAESIWRSEDAALIAAAPELYIAADNALNALIGCCIPAGGVDDRKTILEAQAMLRDAINKAKGSA